MLSLPEYSLSTRNVIHHMDALQLMRGLPAGSVDVIVTSPPYNMRQRNKKTSLNRVANGKTGKWNPLLSNGYSTHKDDLPDEVYISWQRAILAECLRVIKSTGAVFYNHKWRIQDKILDMRHKIVDGFPVRQVIIWQRAGGLNFNNHYFLPTYEVIYLIAKPDFVLSKGANHLGDIWYISQESNNPHPAPFPIELPLRCIRSAQYNELICDPFMGSGTTALAAQIMHRDFIGGDSSAEYVAIARKRLQDSDPFQASVHDNGTKQLSLFESVA